MRDSRTQACIGRDGGRWHLYVPKDAENATQALWLSLGGCGDYGTAFRLYTALLGGSEKR